jgi:hypothetical protein
VPRERVLITVKTYPTLSRKYGETVCTAGIREDGSWLRIYPVPFRRLEEEEQYKKFDWLECDLVPNPKDPRPETRRPSPGSQLKVASHLGTSDGWRERRRFVLKTAKVYSSLQALIEGAKSNQLSLAVFKPTRVKDLVFEEDDREWDSGRVAVFREQSRQGDLFSDESWRETFKLIPKLPCNFSYRFEDESGRASELQVLDWEIGMLFWNCLKDCGNEADALQKVRAKYLDTFLGTDLHFFLGTTQQFHFVAPNPWVIIGVFPIPHETQASLF